MKKSKEELIEECAEGNEEACIEVGRREVVERKWVKWDTTELILAGSATIIAVLYWILAIAIGIPLLSFNLIFSILIFSVIASTLITKVRQLLQLKQ